MCLRRLEERLVFMDNLKRKRLMYSGVFYAMACDGVLHASEKSEIVRILNESILYEGINRDGLMDELMSTIRSDPRKAIDAYLDELKASDLIERHKLTLIESIIRVINSDNVVDKSEVAYMRKVCLSLNLDINALVSRFPQHSNLFIDSDSGDYRR